MAAAPRAASDGARLLVSDPSYPSESFSVAPEACGAAACPFILAYTGVHGASQASLTWATAQAPVTVGPSGVGEVPSQTNTPIPAKALHTGDESAAVHTTLRPVALAPGVSAVLVDQVRQVLDKKGERPKSAHALYVAREKKLERVWSYEDGAGPTGSTTAVLALDPERAAVQLVTDDRLSDTTSDADRFTVTLLRWDDHVVEESSPSVRAAVVGGYATVWAAKQARSRAGQCLQVFAVLPSQSFVYTRNREPFVLAIVAADETTATRLFETAQRCGTNVKGAVAPLKR